MELKQLQDKFEELKQKALEKEIKEGSPLHLYSSARRFYSSFGASYSNSDAFKIILDRFMVKPKESRISMPVYEMLLRIANLWEPNSHVAEVRRLNTGIILLSAYLDDVILERNNASFSDVRGGIIASFSSNSFYGLCGGRIFGIGSHGMVLSNFQKGYFSFLLANMGKAYKTNLLVFSDADKQPTYSLIFPDGGPAKKLVSGVLNWNTNHRMNLYACEVQEAINYSLEKLTPYGITRSMLDYKISDFLIPRDHFQKVLNYYKERSKEKTVNETA